MKHFQFYSDNQGGRVTYPRMHHFQLYYQNRDITWSDHLKMDAFVEEPCQAPMFRKRKLLYLYCLDTEHVFELTVPSLPFLKIKCLFGHVSFPGALSERRIVVFPQSERTIGKVKDVVSPCVIVVTSSVDFQVGIFFNSCYHRLCKDRIFLLNEQLS